MIKTSIDLDTTFSNDVSLEFRQEKCIYMIVEKGKKIINQASNKPHHQ